MHNTTDDIDTVIGDLDGEVRREVAGLRSRAESLRHQAEALDEVLAVTYRRRASELEMEAWILSVQHGIATDTSDTDEAAAAAAA